jgi:hypothetical protein
VFDIFCSQSDPMEFSLFSLMLPQFKSSNSSSFYPISFALSFILVTYISSPKEEIITYLCWGFQKHDIFS